MGLSSSSSTSGPSVQALPYLTKASSAVTDAYSANQGNLGEISSGLKSAFDAYSARNASNPTMHAARGVVTSRLTGDPASNPELDKIIGTTNGDITDRINAIFNRAGQSGSSRQIGELGKQLSANESGLRYTDYNTQQALRTQAIQDALGINASDNQTALGEATLGEAAASTPYLGAQFLAQGLGGLWGNAQTKTSDPSTFDAIQKGIGTAANIASIFSDRRLKKDIEHVGTLPDGLGVYRYSYIWEGGDQKRLGVMAQEVEQLRPWALGPVRDGFMTVNYSKLETA